MRMIAILLAGMLVNTFAVCQSVSKQERNTRLKKDSLLFSEWSHGPDLVQRMRAAGKDISVGPIVKELLTVCPSCPPPDPTNHPMVRIATNSSDLVVIAHDVMNVCAFTPGNSFIFTDSQLVIDDVWRSDSAYAQVRKLTMGSEITLTNPGGQVTIGEHTITDIPSNVIPLKTGHRYLLYLKYLPESSSFKNASLNGFDITGDKVSLLRTTEAFTNGNLQNDLQAFLAAMKSSTLRANKGNNILD